jgi:TonB-linked SusC/RagA family outer membrane protein
MQGALGRRFATRAASTGLLLAMSAPGLLAQATGTIRGRVVSEGGRPLDAAQVWIPGTNRVSRTDDKGDYRLTGVPAGTVQLRAQQLGFTSITRPITVGEGETVTADFTLREAALSLDAMVVTGTAAETRKKEVGNATAMISARDIQAAPVNNTQDIITARAPGVTVLQNSGQPGAGGTIRLRGTNSVTQGNNPIIYLNGIRIFSDAGPNIPGARQNTLALNDIKADDIERIEVVKGAAATTLYGTEASGGVIQIFTKMGTATAPEWSMDVGGGVNSMGHVGSSKDPTGVFLNECRGPDLHDAGGNVWVDPTCPASGSWLKNGAVQQYSLSVRGGVQQTTYFLSGNFNDDRGVIPTNESKSGGLRANFSFAPAKNLIVNFNSSYNRNEIRFIPDGNLANGFTLNVMRGNAGNFKGGKGNDCTGITVTCITNRYVLEQSPQSSADHFIGGLTFNWSPTTALTNRFSLGYDYNLEDNATVIPFGYLNLATGSINKSDWNHTKLSLDYAGSYQHGLFNLSTTSSWGGQLFDDRDHFIGETGTFFSGPGDPTLGSAALVGLPTVTRPRVVNAGFFVQEMAGWRDRLFVTAGLRVDGNSSFGSDFGLQPYPKLSVSYVLSDEGFWPTRFLPTFKLRAAIGESGKAPGAFDATKTWDPVAADEGKPAVTPAQLGNPKLGPERTREVEVGFDLAALGDRLGLEATLYRAKTIDALIGVNYPPSEGFTRAQLENVGTLENRGAELSVFGTPLRLRGVEWSGRISYTAMASKAIDLGGRIISSGVPVYVREGYPVGSFFAAKMRNTGANEDPVVDLDQFIGPVYPTHILGINTSLRLYENLNFDVLGEYQGGAYNANWVGYQNAIRQVWYPCYEIQAKMLANASLDGYSAIERGRCAYDAARRNSDFWIQPTRFFKIRTASVSYRLPERLTPRLKGATLALSGRNLWKSTKYNGLDPELRDAADAGNTLSRREYYQLPPYRQFILSVRTSF